MTNNDEMGYVYVMENEMFPGLLKIGRTSNTPEERAKNFDTGLPKPWTVVCAVQLRNPKLLERTLHNLFAFRRLKKDREFFHFSYEDDSEKRDIETLFGFFTKAAAYEIVDATDEIEGEVEYYENKPDNNSIYILKKNGETIVRATLDSENNEFVFDRNVSGVKEPNFTDNNGSALNSAKRLYNAFVVGGEINQDGVFLLENKRVPVAKMSRYTVVLLNASVDWTKYWQDEVGIKFKNVLKMRVTED